jgi:NADH-quinone oxidoreductase subunit A
MELSSGSTLLWPFIVYAIAVVLLVGGILVISDFLGERHEEDATNEPYEGGISATGTARLRFPVHFYIIAMFFVIFDVAGAFVVTWVIAIREVRWTGYAAIVIFSGVLFSVLLYLSKIGAFSFGLDPQKILEILHHRNKEHRTP